MTMSAINQQAAAAEDFPTTPDGARIVYVAVPDISSDPMWLGVHRTEGHQRAREAAVALAAANTYPKGQDAPEQGDDWLERMLARAEAIRAFIEGGES